MDTSYLLHDWRSPVRVASVKLLRYAKHQAVNKELDGTRQLQQQSLGYHLGRTTTGLLRQHLKGKAGSRGDA
jgi:hypothetical protein